MSEAPRTHSEQSKAKISFSLRKLWAGRLKWKRARKKFLSSWAGSIAEASRKGGIGEEELNWDSYDRLREEIAAQLLMMATERAKKREIKSAQTMRRSHAREAKMARLKQRRIEHEKKAEARAERKRRMHKKAKEVKEESKCKTKLTKAQKKKSVICSAAGIMSSNRPCLERLDFVNLEKEHIQNRVSLADQIRAAKTRRVESTTVESLATLLDKA